MSAARPRVRNFAGRVLSEEEVSQVLAIDRLKAWAVIILVSFIGLGLFTLMMTPLARSIAGTTTRFSFQVSFAFNFALGITTVSGAAGCIGLNRARRRHKHRARRLEAELAQARGIEPVSA